MKKICVVTAARSDYGLLQWLIKDLSISKIFQLQLVVTGGHLLKSQGHTIDQIRQDGNSISYVVDAGLDTSSTASLAASMGRMAEGFSECFRQLQPDYILVLGDRYELLPICNTAFVMRIPIIHLSGGDVTEGAIDDGVRNAVTMLATYHFPGTEESAENISRMRGNKKNIWPVGEPGLDIFNRLPLWDRKTLADNLKLDVSKKWVLMTYHPETKESLEYNLNAVRNIFLSLEQLENFQTVITYANADFGGRQINNLIQELTKGKEKRFVVVPSLGQQRYVSFMRQVAFTIGNSSSGICEAPFLKIPVVNIGSRQKGRHICDNIIQSRTDVQSIFSSIQKALSKQHFGEDSSYWGDGHASERIEEILSNTISHE